MEIDEEVDDEILDEIITFSRENQLDTEPSTEHSPFVYVQNEDGTLKEIRKSTMVWLLTESKEKLSADRLKRVQTTSNPKRQKSGTAQTTNPSTSLATNSPAKSITATNICTKLCEIEIGQLCVFKIDAQTEDLAEDYTGVLAGASAEPSNLNIIQDYLIDAVVRFRYFDENKERQKPFAMDSAKVMQADEKIDTRIDVLGCWYYLDDDGTLHSKITSSFFIPIHNYLGTIAAPDIKSDEYLKSNQLFLKCNVTNLKNELAKLLVEMQKK